MIKFTKEEISLCKQVAEKHRKETKHGDWYISYDGGIKLKALHQKGYRNEECILLWTISDCLEFLREKGWRVIHLSEEKSGWYTKIITYDKSVKLYVHTVDGKTPLEACLKAVLAVLEKEDK